MKKELGPIRVELVDNDTTSFYRFFYRKDNLNNEIHRVELDNVVMNKLNLHTRIFTTDTGLKNYLDEINNNTINVSAGDLLAVTNGVRKFLDEDKSCLEIILPVIEGNNYSQGDINEIYNAATSALGI